MVTETLESYKQRQVLSQLIKAKELMNSALILVEQLNMVGTQAVDLQAVIDDLIVVEDAIKAEIVA